MNPLIGLVLGFFGRRFLHFAVYGVIGLAIWGVYQKFISPSTSTKIGHIEKQVNVYETPRQDLFSLGCANLKVEAYWKKRIKQSK